MNVLTDVGGVTFTFDKERRKEIWVARTNQVLKHVRAGGDVTDLYPTLTVNRYADRFGIETDFNTEFKGYATTIETGDDALKDMLLSPTATALLEHIQGVALQTEELTAEVLPGVRDLLDYIVANGGVVKGYSTGGEIMPDQFHQTLGLDAMVGNVRSTFPTHLQKHKSPDDVVEEARILYGQGRVFEAMIDDTDRETIFWARARQTIATLGMGDPTVYLLKRDEPDSSVGVVGTDLADIVVVNSLDLVRRGIDITRESSYEPQFGHDDKKFG